MEAAELWMVVKDKCMVDEDIYESLDYNMMGPPSVKKEPSIWLQYLAEDQIVDVEDWQNYLRKLYEAGL